MRHKAPFLSSGNAGYYLQLKAVRLSFVLFDLWQEEVLQARPADSVYNDPWGVHSRKVGPYHLQVLWLLSSLQSVLLP